MEEMADRGGCCGNSAGGTFLCSGDDDTVVDHHSGIDCLHQLRQSTGPFHYLINEQAKSLVALQELQHEVGALLEFRDLVIDTFPNLRTKFTTSSTPSTMMMMMMTPQPPPPNVTTAAASPPPTAAAAAPQKLASPLEHLYSHYYHYHQARPHIRSNSTPSIITTPTSCGGNLPISIRTNDWTPGVRVRRKLNGSTTKDDSNASSIKSKKTGDVTAIQDSGFSTETSSKETHSASSTVPHTSSSAPGGHEVDEDDELWHLLDIIHTKGTRLKEEVELLQNTLKDRNSCTLHDQDDFQQVLYHASTDDVRLLRQERDLLLDRLAEMEAEVLAGRVHTTRLQEDLENLLSAKHDLEEQLKTIVTQRGEVNSRIHDLHLQFVGKCNNNLTGAGSPDNVKIMVLPNFKDASALNTSSSTTSSSSSTSSHHRTVFSNSSGKSKCVKLCAIDDPIVPKVKIVNSSKFSSILMERNPLVLQRHLLSTTVQNQVLQEKLDTVSRVEYSLVNKLDKAKEENDELRFQLEDKNIELEGTKARVRILEQHQQKSVITNTLSPDVIPISTAAIVTTTLTMVNSGDCSLTPEQSLIRNEITTASMKAMRPIAMNLQLDHSSSTESAHDHAENLRKGLDSSKRKPSKIPLKSYTAPKAPPPSILVGSLTGRNPNTSSTRYASTVQWRNRSTTGGDNNSLTGCNRSGSNSGFSITKSRNGSLVSAKDSLSNKLRNSDSLSKTSPQTPVSTTTNCSTVLGTTNGGNNRNNVVIKKNGSALKWTNSSSSTAAGSIISKDGSNDKLETNYSSLQQMALLPVSTGKDSANTETTCLDSLDRIIWHNNSSQNSHSNDMVLNRNVYHHDIMEFFDSIDSKFSVSSVCHQRLDGEELAECDSLEKHQFSDSSHTN